MRVREYAWGKPKCVLGSLLGTCRSAIDHFFFNQPSPLHAHTMQAKAWFLLAHKHKDIRTRRMAKLTQFSIPPLLNPMINKMADGIASHMFAWRTVCMRSGSKWLMIGARLCAYACAYVDPVFTSQSYDISISTSTRRTNLPVFLVLILMLMSTQFSFALQMCLCLCLRAKENQA